MTNTPAKFKRTKKSNDLNFNPFDVGKLPPQAPDLEEAVLGAIMLEKKAIDEVVELLRPESFYIDAHARIFSAIMDLYNERQGIDILTVTNQLKKREELEIIGGAYYVSKLTNRVASSANIVFHARIVAQKYIARELIRISTLTIRMAFEDSTDILDTIDILEGELTAISTNISIGSEAVQVKDVWQELRDANEQRIKNKGVNGIPSCHQELDLLTAGWQKSDLIVIAARPAMGKTAFVLNMARNCAINYGKKIMFFSLEMSAVQLCTRLISSDRSIPIYKLTKTALNQDEWFEMEKGVNDLMNAPLYIDDTPSLSIFGIRAKIRRAVREQGIEMVIIDYLQLMQGDSSAGRNRDLEISSITRGLKILAKELNIPIIVLSQLNREVEKRGGDKRPQLADLRESGSIEQDADFVAFIHRPEYYGDTSYSNGESAVGIAEFIIKKYRNGSQNTVKLRYIGEYTRFEDLNEYKAAKLPIGDIVDFTQSNAEKEKDEDLF